MFGALCQGPNTYDISRYHSPLSLPAHVPFPLSGGFLPSPFPSLAQVSPQVPLSPSPSTHHELRSSFLSLPPTLRTFSGMGTVSPCSLSGEQMRKWVQKGAQRSAPLHLQFQMPLLGL